MWIESPFFPGGNICYCFVITLANFFPGTLFPGQTSSHENLFSIFRASSSMTNHWAWSKGLIQRAGQMIIWAFRNPLFSHESLHPDKLAVFIWISPKIASAALFTGRLSSFVARSRHDCFWYGVALRLWIKEIQGDAALSLPSIPRSERDCSPFCNKVRKEKGFLLGPPLSERYFSSNKQS